MKKRFLIFTILLFSIKANPVFAQDSPPEPCTLCPPVGLPLDDHLYILVIAGVLVGGYLKFKRTKIVQ